MPEITAHAHGAPCWADMATPGLDAADAFYTDLFGWEADPAPTSGGAYRTMTLDGLEVCAVYSMSPERAGAGERPAWLVYLNVADAEAVTARVEVLGGRVRAPVFDVPGVGRMALIADPSGGIVALWEAGPRVGARVWGDAGAIAWTELTTPDREAAVVFFAQLLGLRPQNLEGSRSYTVLHGEEGPVFGVLQMDENWPRGTPPHWMTYFAVVDADDATGHVRDLGGRVEVEPFDTPFGRIAVVTDPVGGYFSLVEPMPASGAG